MKSIKYNLYLKMNNLSPRVVQAEEGRGGGRGLCTSLRTFDWISAIRQRKFLFSIFKVKTRSSAKDIQLQLQDA